jgi:hypothetical protein
VGTFYPSTTTWTQTQYPYDFYASSFPAPDILDERHNPKMWAQWFREFLIEKIPARV